MKPTEPTPNHDHDHDRSRRSSTSSNAEPPGAGTRERTETSSAPDIGFQPGPRRTNQSHGLLLSRTRAGLPRKVRIRYQVERDDLIHQLRGIDAELASLADERLAALSRLGNLRDTLWPVEPGCKGRRPPACEHPPLPPARSTAIPLVGTCLRSTCRAILSQHGPLSLRDLHARLHAYGYRIAHRQPVKTLADALGYETRMGRTIRVARGTYSTAPGSSSSEVLGDPYDPDLVPDSGGSPSPSPSASPGSRPRPNPGPDGSGCEHPPGSPPTTSPRDRLPIDFDLRWDPPAWSGHPGFDEAPDTQRLGGQVSERAGPAGDSAPPAPPAPPAPSAASEGTKRCLR